MLVSVTDAKRLLSQVRARANRGSSSLSRVASQTKKRLTVRTLEVLRAELQRAYGYMREIGEIMEVLVE
jgi:hypothetical protein